MRGLTILGVVVWSAFGVSAWANGMSGLVEAEPDPRVVLTRRSDALDADRRSALEDAAWAALGGSRGRVVDVYAADVVDRDLGDASRERGWAVKFDEVVIAQDITGRLASVDLTLVFGLDGTLGWAISRSRGVWLRPENRGYGDVREQLERRQYEIAGPARGDLARSVTGVLAYAWAVFGTNPSLAGQIVIRPRWGRSFYPAEPGEDGQNRPLFGAHNLWFVDFIGNDLGRSGHVPSARKIAVFSDTEAEFRGQYFSL